MEQERAPTAVAKTLDEITDVRELGITAGQHTAIVDGPRACGYGRTR